MFRKILSIALFCAAVLGGAFDVEAQQPIFTYPVPAPTKNLSSTIAVTNTFQSIQASNPPKSSTQYGRLSCLVQNNGTHNMWVFFGDVANATTATSVVLAAGMSVSCTTVNGVVLTDQVSITGTAGDAFYAGFQ